ncbi:MAG TPA: LuxR C-terminal-related transcriptional regulator [Polyangiaceae bacterium]|nr:LuxR C-terminal-related transcriptional regulator [Polyangiaceae bacterium]
MATFPALVDASSSPLPTVDGVLDGSFRVVRLSRDGTRFRVVLRGPRRSEGGRLSRREQTIVRRLVLGHCQKLVAFDFGLAHTTVSSHLRSSLDKMGLERWEVAVLVAAIVEGAHTPLDPTPEDALQVGPLAPGERVVALERDVGGKAFVRLTEAERAVALRIVEGRTNAEIGLERSSSARTVANQVSSVFRKAEVHGRCELIRLLLLGREQTERTLAPNSDEPPVSGRSTRGVGTSTASASEDAPTPA